MRGGLLLVGPVSQSLRYGALIPLIFNGVFLKDLIGDALQVDSQWLERGLKVVLIACAKSLDGRAWGLPLLQIPNIGEMRSGIMMLFGGTQARIIRARQLRLAGLRFLRVLKPGDRPNIAKQNPGRGPKAHQLRNQGLVSL
jgi:hypothetical protein